MNRTQLLSGGIFARQDGLTIVLIACLRALREHQSESSLESRKSVSSHDPDSAQRRVDQRRDWVRLEVETGYGPRPHALGPGPLCEVGCSWRCFGTPGSRAALKAQRFKPYRTKLKVGRNVRERCATKR